MKVLGNIDVDLDVVNKEYVDGKIKNIDVSGQLQDYATNEDLSLLRGGLATLTVELSRKSELKHKHSISDINNLQTTLNGKAGKNHTHTEYLKKGDPIQLTSAQKAELKGERGAPGTPGKDGQNGMITYIRYANNPSGDNMTATPQSDTTHIGIYTYEGRNAPTAPSVYLWTRIKGDPGESINTWTGTQAEYDRIYRKSPTTLYIITG